MTYGEVVLDAKRRPRQRHAPDQHDRQQHVGKERHEIRRLQHSTTLERLHTRHVCSHVVTVQHSNVLIPDVFTYGTAYTSLTYYVRQNVNAGA